MNTYYIQWDDDDGDEEGGEALYRVEPRFILGLPPRDGIEEEEEDSHRESSIPLFFFINASISMPGSIEWAGPDITFSLP